MMRDTNTLLSYEAKRNPMLRGMLASPSQFSRAEIEAQRFPKWIREHLFGLQASGQQQVEFDSLRTRISKRIKDGHTADPIGMMCQWTGDTKFIKLNDRGELEVKTGELVWFPKTGGVWMDTIFSRRIDPVLHDGVQKVKEVPRSQYQAAVRNRRNGAHPNDLPRTVCPDAEDAATPGGPLDHLPGVRFFSVK